MGESLADALRHRHAQLSADLGDVDSALILDHGRLLHADKSTRDGSLKRLGLGERDPIQHRNTQSRSAAATFDASGIAEISAAQRVLAVA